MKLDLHVRKATPGAVVMCDFGQIPLHVFWRKMLAMFEGRIYQVTGSSKKLLHKLSSQAPLDVNKCLVGWMPTTSKGLLSEGTFSFLNALTTLRDTWFSEVCQSSSTKVQSYLDNMHLDCDKMAPCLHARPPPA